uniref:glycosyltransferase family 2 protein n=1 Tax=Flavobacterium sp. TaxID=239 RepID=UPI00404A57A1
MTNTNPLVSILMNAYNAETYLVEAIGSIYLQTYKNWEIIFIDNCSTDSTSEIANKYDEKLRYFKTPVNLPLGIARNYGLGFCKGDFVAFLDSDDVWLKNKLEKQLEFHFSNPEIIMSYTGGYIINSNSDILKNFSPRINKEVFPGLLEKYDVNLQTILIKNIINFKFSENKFYCEDFDLAINIAAKYPVGLLIDKLVKYRIHKESFTNKLKQRWHIEFRETLNDLVSFDSYLMVKHKLSFRRAYAKADYYEARFLKEECDESIIPFKIVVKNSVIDFRYLIIAFLLLLPINLWDGIRRKLSFF